MRPSPPREIGGLAVTAFEDLRDEHGRMGPLKGATDAAARNFLIFRLGERRLTLRPSGTEPKAKAYVEVCSPPCSLEITDVDLAAIVSGNRRVGETTCGRFSVAGAGTGGVESRLSRITASQQRHAVIC